MIELLCPECGHPLKVPERFIGQKAGCKHCKGRFIVPGPSSTETDAIEDPLPGEDLMPTSFSKLDTIDIDEGPSAFDDAGPQPDTASASAGLGCLYWGLAFFVPPIALIWAAMLPSGDSQKPWALAASGVMTIVLALCFTLAFALSLPAA